jgi:hypothetical protein
MTLVIYEEPVPPRRGRVQASPRSVHLGTLMVLIAVVAVCLALLRAAPGLGILLILVLVPASARTVAAVVRRQSRGKRMFWDEKLELFVLSIGIVVVIGIASAAAFLATCFPSGLLLTNAAGIPGLIAAVIVGVGAGGYVAFRLIRVLWPYKGS